MGWTRCAGAAVCIVLATALLAGCGGDEDSGAREPPLDADTAGLPDYMRRTVACLREAGVKVRVPAAVRRLVERGEFKGDPRRGAEPGLLSFLYFEKGQKFTEAQILAARRCSEKQ